MKKNSFLTLLLLLIGIVAQAQENKQSIKFNLGAAHLTSGDNQTISGSFSYQRLLKNQRFKIIASLRSTYAATDAFSLNGWENLTIIEKDRNYIDFLDILRPNLEDGDAVLLSTKGDKSFYSSLDLGLGYNLINKPKNKLSANIGMFFSYVDKTGIVGATPGEFTSIFGEDEDITIVSPYYVNFFDYGTFYQIEYQYHREKTYIGTEIGAHFFHLSKDRIYTLLNFSFGVKF